MDNFGFLRVAAAVPTVKVADTSFNVSQICSLADEAERREVSLVVFPELGVTGYTCADLFGSNFLIDNAEKAVKAIAQHSKGKQITIVVGTPVSFRDRLYNCAAVIRNGEVRGLVPKVFMPGYNEFYEPRWFASGEDMLSGAGASDDCWSMTYAGYNVKIHPCQLFRIGDASFAVEICEDVWTPVPPSSFHAVAGAEVIVNLSASNEVLLKHDYRKNLIAEQSARTLSAYIYSSCGYGESTQDLVFAGSSLFYENGALLDEADRFSMEPQLLVADVDIEKLKVLRQKQSTFSYVTPDGRKPVDAAGKYLRVDLGKPVATDFGKTLERYIEPHPFVPGGDSAEIDRRCKEIIAIQTLGLATRLARINSKTAVIGISGGLDSTLALLVAVMAFDKLGWSRDRVIGVTMPGLGTTVRTHSNAADLMAALGVTSREISVVPAVNQHFKDIGHDPDVKNTTYENSQARERTQILMDISNQTGGIVVGTGDLSELALGWCTYNGDHMSMYAVNAGVPKTLVRSLCKWAADNVFAQTADSQSDMRPVKEILYDIIDTPISPELIPADGSGNIVQLTEDLVGPYELHDFFLYHFFRFGCSPQKVLFLAKHAFATIYTEEVIRKWLRSFLHRFFSQQFKRSCLPDGPKVGSVTLSPRGDWRMPSDAWSTDWLDSI